MAFDDGTQTGATRSLGVSSGEFQAVRPTYEAVPALVATPGADVGVGSAPVPNLHYVFDDPNDGEPGRDRMLVHGIWELVLALAIAGVGFALSQARPGALGGDQLRDLLLAVTIVGLLGIASAFALRAGVPNLAVGGAAAVAAVWVTQNADGGDVLVPAATAVGICAAIGLVQGLVVAGLHVPAWAASLGVLLVASAWAVAQHLGRANLDYAPHADAYLWFAGFAAVSVIGSLFGLAPGIRRGLARFRPVVDPARRRTRAAAIVAVIATTVSMVVGGLAGVFMTMNGTPPLDGVTAPELTALGLGAALLGGTSAFGRRGGIFGTVFASCLVVLVMAWVAEIWPDSPELSLAYFAAGAIGVGLIVTRLVERFGRPVLQPASDDDESWMPRVHSFAPASRPWQPAPTPTGGLWSSDEGWGEPTR